MLRMYTFIGAFALAGLVLCVDNCASKQGTHLVNINVHMDGAALLALQRALDTEFSIDFNTHSAAVSFINGIFDMVNVDLESYGVQVTGVYTNLLLDKYKPDYDHFKCTEGNPVSERAMTAVSAIKQKDSSEDQNHLLVFFCEEMVKLPPKGFVYSYSSCDNVAAFMFGELRVLAGLIHDGVMAMLSTGKYCRLDLDEAAFNSALCERVKKCDKKSFGKLVRALKKVRHIVTRKYIIKGNLGPKHPSRVNYVSHKGHDIEAEPLEEYSNEDELHSDFSP